MALYTNDLQKLYVAYFSRPADPTGLAYWESAIVAGGAANATATLTAISNSFAASAEYKANFAGMDNDHIVAQVYQNLFSRAPDPAGLTFWSLALTKGDVTLPQIVRTISESALASNNTDGVAFTSKVTAATAFTGALDTTPEILGYSGTAALALAKTFISGVTDAATLATAIASPALAATVVSVTDAGNVVAGQTYTLTTGVDTVVGTAGNDTFTGVIGGSDTLTVLDNLDGGKGGDVLNLSDLAGGTALPAGVTVKSIETLNFQSAGAATIDTSTGFTGLTKVNVTISSGADVVTVGDGTALSVVSSAGTVSATATDSGLTVSAAGAVTAAGGSSQTITTSGAVTASGSTGAIIVTDSAQAAAAIAINDGTSVSLTTTTVSTGTITIGGGTAPTGTVTVVENLKGTGALTGGAIAVTGGTVDSITVNATQATKGSTTTVGAITVTGTTDTTSVTVAETAAVTAVASVTAVDAVTETGSALFVALTAGQTLIVGGLTFTAGAAGTTAAQTAAAFANLTTGATQGNSVLGTYQGAVTGWTSGAASTATVLFTSTAAGNVADLAFTGTGTAPTLTLVQGVAAVAAAGVGGIANGAITIADVNYGSATKAGTITTATLSNFTTANVNDNALTTLSVTNGTGNIIIDNSGLTTATNKTLNLAISGQTAGTLDDADIYTTLNITTGATKSTLSNVTLGALTALTVAGTTGLTLTSAAGMTALKTVTVSGAAGLTATLTAATTTAINTAASTGTSTITMDATKATYTGGAGVDKVTTSAATPTKAIALGDGNDSLTLASGTTSTTAALTGGAGTDTLTMVAADAVTASGSALFASLVSGFEVLGLTGGTGAQTVAIDVLGGYNSVTTGAEAAASTLTMSGFTSGGTLTLTSNAANAATSNYAVTGSTFAAGTADVFNVALSKSGALTGGVVTAADVETINLSANDTGGNHAADTVTLVATSATSIVVTGSAALTLTNTGNTAVTSIDASAMTGGLTVTAAGTVAETIKGGAGSNVLTASTGTVADVLIGGAGADTLTANAGLDTLTGGAGMDNFIVTVSTNLNTYATITDASIGDTIQFANKGTETFTAAAITLAPTAVFQDYANAAINAGGDASTNGYISWFQYGGNTYVVESRHDATGTLDFQNGTDMIVKLTGLVDLTHTSLNNNPGNAILLIG